MLVLSQKTEESVVRPPRREGGMRPSTHLAPGGSSLSFGPRPQALWYVSDRRIRTQAAARHAARIAAWATTGGGLDTEPGEHALFAALHTCAYRAARCGPGKPASAIEREEWSRWWRDIRECIVKKNLGLVYTMLGRIRSHDEDEDDRLSEAMYGLARAVERFDPWRGYRFSTYACNAISRSLLRRGERHRQYRALFPVQHEARLERPSELPDSQAALYAERLNKIMSANLGELTALEAKIIAERFPRDRDNRLTLQRVADGLGLCKERVRQIQDLALRKLRMALENDPILQ